MAFPLAMVPLALSAVRALLKLRIRVDNILVDKETAVALPFDLPPLPEIDPDDAGDLKVFFQTSEGRQMLVLLGMEDDFDRYLADPSSLTRPEKNALFEAYYRAAGIGSEENTPPPTAEDLLNHYLVYSYRVTNNPATVRLLLATADTMLEFAGENATDFISNPKTANIVGVMLAEFAGREDFDDASLDRIYKRLLGSAVVAALDNREALPDHPALLILYSALGEIREEKKDDFVATIISAEGFQSVVSSYLTIAAKDPLFLDSMARMANTDDLNAPERTVIRSAFTATLTELGTNFSNLVDDPHALKGVLEAAIVAAAQNAGPLIRTLDDDQPVMSAVFKAVAEKVAAQRDLFDSLGNGALIGSLYEASLRVVATNPDLDADGIQSVTEKIVGGIAQELSAQSLKDTLAKLRSSKGLPTVNRLVARSVSIIAEFPEVITGNDAYAKAVISGILRAGSPLIRDGLDVEDLIEVVQVGIGNAMDNLGLLNMDEQLREVLILLGSAINADGDFTETLGSLEGRKQVLFAGLEAVAANPRVWEKFKEVGLVQPIVLGVIDGLKADGGNLLSGPALVDGLRGSLQALIRRGAKLAEDIKAELEADENFDLDARALIQTVIRKTLETADAEVGKSITREDVPEFLERVLGIALKAGLGAAGGPLNTAIAEIRNHFDQV